MVVSATETRVGDFVMFINRLCNAFAAAGVDYAIVGGYAVALHGAVRGTLDVDCVIAWREDMLRKAVAVLEFLGLRSSLPVTAQEIFMRREAYIRDRNLIAWHFYHPHHPLEQVDLLIHYDLTEHVTDTIRTPAGPICILSKTDLIAMKRSSGRPQDLADIQALEAL